MSLRPLTAAVAACGALTLAACSEPAADPEPTDTASGDETVTLTVYTSEPEDKVDEINAAFTEQNPDIDVEVYRAGTGDLKARIAAEQQAGEIGADILWAADSATFDTYAEDGVLADISDLDTSEVIEEARGTENYVGTRIIPTVIAYNENETEEADRPSSWQDLADPKYQDQIVMPDPAVSGAAAFNASVWRNEPSLGDDWFEALGENSPMIAESNGPTSQEVASGGHPYGVFVDYLARDLKEQGSPVEVIYPEEGAPLRHRARGHLRRLEEPGRREEVPRVPHLPRGPGARRGTELPSRARGRRHPGGSRRAQRDRAPHPGSGGRHPRPGGRRRGVPGCRQGLARCASPCGWSSRA